MPSIWLESRQKKKLPRTKQERNKKETKKKKNRTETLDSSKSKRDIRRKLKTSLPRKRVSRKAHYFPVSRQKRSYTHEILIGTLREHNFALRIRLTFKWRRFSVT